MTKGKKKTEPSGVTTPEQVDQFERIAKQLVALHAEFAAHAKSKADNPINKFKVKMLNEKIVAANQILAGVFKPFDGFAQFDEDELPTNSDVSLVLTTYLASLERWRSAHVEYDDDMHDDWFWRTRDRLTIKAEAATRYTPEEK